MCDHEFSRQMPSAPASSTPFSKMEAAGQGLQMFTRVDSTDLTLHFYTFVLWQMQALKGCNISMY